MDEIKTVFISVNKQRQRQIISQESITKPYRLVATVLTGLKIRLTIHRQSVL